MLAPAYNIDITPIENFATFLQGVDAFGRT